MSDNKDLEDRINELERAKLQKRIAELEAELRTKPNVKEELAGSIPGQEGWKATSITKRTRKHNKVYQLGEALFLLLPVFAFLFYFFKGGITLWNISSENITESFQEILPYIAVGFILYLVIMELIWRLLIFILFGRKGNDGKTRANEGAKPVNPVARSADAVAEPAAPAVHSTAQASQPALGKPKPAKNIWFYLIAGVLVIIVVFAFVLFGKSLFPKINLTGLPLGSGPEGTQYWKGTFPDTFTTLGYFETWGKPVVEISGIPWMILTYDVISGDITHVDVGMTDVTYIVLIADPNEPDDPDAQVHLAVDRYLADSSYWKDRAMSIMGITGPIYVLASAEGSDINMGVQSFSFEWFYHERWTFNYTSDQMTGGIENLDPTVQFGRQSEANAFHLIRIK